MTKEILQITITSRKASKNKIIRWLQWRWFDFWCIFKPKMLSKFYWFMSEMFLRMLPKKQREELRKEYEEIDVLVIDKREKDGK